MQEKEASSRATVCQHLVPQKRNRNPIKLKLLVTFGKCTKKLATT